MWAIGNSISLNLNFYGNSLLKSTAKSMIENDLANNKHLCLNSFDH